jgi:hypothetical protein
MNFDFFETTRKLKFFEPKKSHHLVDPDRLIIKMYSVSGFEIVLNKIIEANPR